MLKKIAFWSFFSVFSVSCIAWLAVLVMDAAQSESIRWGAKKNRAERARKATGPIVIGVAGGWKKGYQPLLNGVNMARDEINRQGGLLNRPISVIPMDDEMSVVTGMRVAQEFSDNQNMVAVIAHPNSKVSLSTAVIYEYYGLLMLSPLSTNPALTRQGRSLIFRNIPSDDADGVTLAEYAAEQGYQRVAIYYLRDDYSRGLANIFERRCYELGISIVDRLPYESTYKPIDYSGDFNLWKRQFKFDAVMLAGFLPQAADVIKTMRKAGITVPILSGGSLDNNELITRAGEDAENLIVVSTFDAQAANEKVASFVSNYQQKFNQLPNRNAAQGYDALYLLAHVIKTTGSTVPTEMADTLHSVTDWVGVTGPHTFDADGDVHGKPMILKKVQNGQFQILR